MDFKAMVLQKMVNLVFVLCIMAGASFMFKGFFVEANKTLDKTILAETKFEEITKNKNAMNKAEKITDNLKVVSANAKVTSENFNDGTKNIKDAANTINSTTKSAEKVADSIRSGKDINVRVKTDIKDSLTNALNQSEKIISKNFSDERIKNIEDNFKKTTDYATNQFQKTVNDNPIKVEVSGNVNSSIETANNGSINSTTKTLEANTNKDTNKDVSNQTIADVVKSALNN